MLKTLVVEDCPFLRYLFSSLIRKRFPCIELDEVWHGLEVWDKFCNVKHDMILMDIQLPGKNGIALTREIKSAYPDTKIIIMTSHTETEYLEAAMSAGADYFFCKTDVTGMKILEILQHEINNKKNLAIPEFA